MATGSRQNDDTKRAYATRHVGRLVGKMIAAPARRRGFTEATLLHEWEQVVGAGLARRCQPLRIKFRPGLSAGAMLELCANGGAALEIQHAAPQILERINLYFGRRAVRQLKIIQAPIPLRPLPPKVRPPRELQEEERAWIDASVATVSHDGLKASLAALGAAIKGAGKGQR
ncbi:MAG: DciA family protein [Pseudomonadota bacterium]